MATQPIDSKQYVCTLTAGWRITIPSVLRRSRGWHEGSTLAARVEGCELFLTVPEGDVHSGTGALCYLGSGGKVVIPAPLRSLLGWSVGRKLAVTAAGSALKIAQCCHAIQCRSCGAVKNVKEIIPGLYLCSHCWSDYVVLARQRARTRRAQGK